MAEKLGKLQAQVMNGQLKELTIELGGELLHKHSELLKAGVLHGLFAQLMSEPVNYINAPIIAKTMGIRIGEKKEQEVINYTNMLSISYKTDKEERSFAGTVFGGKHLKIVRLDKYYIEGTPNGTFLYYTNIDRPGMVAKVGAIFADANINIAGLSLGRTGIGERALAIVSVDSPIPDSVLQKVKSIDGVFHAQIVTL